MTEELQFEVRWSRKVSDLVSEGALGVWDFWVDSRAG